MSGVRASIMETLTLHNPRSCLEADDLEALNVLYPDCDGSAAAPICLKPALNLGWLRLIIFAFGPLLLSFVAACIICALAMKIGGESGAIKAAAKAEVAAKQAEAVKAAEESGGQRK